LVNLTFIKTEKTEKGRDCSLFISRGLRKRKMSLTLNLMSLRCFWDSQGVRRKVAPQVWRLESSEVEIRVWEFHSWGWQQGGVCD
jgi:hypothetical protein